MSDIKWEILKMDRPNVYKWLKHECHMCGGFKGIDLIEGNNKERERDKITEEHRMTAHWKRQDDAKRTFPIQLTS